LAAKTFKENNNVKINFELFKRELNIWLNFDKNVFENNKIVKLLRTTYIHQKLYALMPFYEKSVSDIIREKIRIDLNDALLVIFDVVEALKNIFEKYGVVHQDIKPANILCKKNDNKKVEFHVGDWGISNIQLKSCPEIPTKKWLPSSFVEIMSNFGTLYYMSPERLIGSPSSILADIYSIGLIFFELLFGILPLNHNSKKPIELQILDGDYFEAACWILGKNSINAKIIPVIQNCIHPDPEKRYPDYSNLEKALKKINRKWIIF
jgi:serine/threonine-protein kinase